MPKTNKPKRVPLAFRVPQVLNDGLREIADERELPLTDVVEEALMGYWRKNRTEKEKKSVDK
jgi:hypothetical protein